MLIRVRWFIYFILAENEKHMYESGGTNYNLWYNVIVFTPD